MDTIINLQIEEYINKAMSFVIFLSTIILLFKHYGDKNSHFEKLFGKLEYFSIKIGLISMAMGTMWGMFQTEITPENEILLNIGLAIYLSWTTVRFNKLFITRDTHCSHKSKI